MANQTNIIISKLGKLDANSRKTDLKKLDDYQLTTVWELLLSKESSELLKSVHVEMIERSLIVDKDFENAHEIYSLVDSSLIGAGHVRVADLFIIVEPSLHNAAPLLIRTEQLDSAVIKEQHAVVTMTLLEVRFQRKSFRDKFVLRTDQLDRWLSLFEKLGVPVEDERAAK